MGIQPSNYLHLQDVYRKWNKENLKHVQANLANRYNLHKLSLKSKVKLYKERQQDIIERLKQGNTPVYNVWASTDYSNKFFEDPSIFAILEDDFARKVDPTSKVESMPEEEQGVYLDYLADILEDDVQDYIKEFHKFLEEHTEFLYIGNKLLEIIDKEDMVSEVLLANDLKVSLTPTPTEDKLLSRKEAIEYLGISEPTMSRYLNEDKYKEYAELLNPISVGGRQKFYRSNLDAFLNAYSRNKK